MQKKFKNRKMKIIVDINNKPTEITLTSEQVAQINKQKELDASTCTLQDCIGYLGEDDQEVINLRQLQKIDVSDRIIANQEAVVMVRAINQRHILDWNNSNEKKWKIWWYLDKEFRFGDSCWADSGSTVASSLCFKSEKLADSFGANKNYVSVCKRFHY